MALCGGGYHHKCWRLQPYVLKLQPYVTKHLAVDPRHVGAQLSGCGVRGLDPAELLRADTRHGESGVHLQVELVDVLEGYVEHIRGRGVVGAG